MLAIPTRYRHVAHGSEGLHALGFSGEFEREVGLVLSDAKQGPVYVGIIGSPDDRREGLAVWLAKSLVWRWYSVGFVLAADLADEKAVREAREVGVLVVADLDPLLAHEVGEVLGRLFVARYHDELPMIFTSDEGGVRALETRLRDVGESVYARFHRSFRALKVK